jgi:uncharacterized metal-binding protein YceD (DUF177 family)
MLINIKGLSDGEHNYNFSEPASGFDLSELNFASNIDSEVRLYKSHNQMTCKIGINAKISFQCDRCLEDFIYNLKTDFEIVYQYIFDNVVEENLEYDTDELKCISHDAGFIDLDNEVRDFILLAIPMKKTPEEKDDICLYCNKKIDDILNIKKEKEVNPVWEKLLANNKKQITKNK